ncbi:MAG: UvrD-helicase domain-containing protein [Firmicutes bacterium]|nr:UvrD-helicase domain-containing protein [Bacillota bacterium]
MGFKPTKQQENAITIIDRDLAVSAGAGSGKTKVLVERYIHLLNNGLNFKDIIAITFTKKAAQEMKDRIRKTLKESPVSRLQKMANEVPTAQISTFHSFCQRIVREHPKEAAIDPLFQLGEEWQVNALLNQVITDILEERLLAGSSDLYEIKEEFSSQKAFVAQLVRIYGDMVGKGITEFHVKEQANYQDRIQSEKIAFQSAMDDLLAIDYSTIKLTPNLRDRLSLLLQGWQEMKESFEYSFGEELMEVIEIFDELLKGNWYKLAEFVNPIRELSQELKQVLADEQGSRYLGVITDILTEVHHRYQEEKRNQGLLDFNDLELLAIKLLTNPQIRERYKVEHLMIDEFQDTNRVQKRIVDLLHFPETKLFIVGDSKQSIYRFRGAEVNVFIEARNQIENNNGKHITLDVNFRSLPGIIDFTNDLFKPLMEGDPIEYEPSTARRDMDPTKTNVQFLATERIAEMTITEAREKEARRIAATIKHLVEKENYQYRDIKMLFRSTSDTHIYEKALQVASIPYINLSGRGFYAKREIQDVLDFIAWLEDPSDVLKEATVLRSPIFNVSSQGLFWYYRGEKDKITSADQARINRALMLYPTLREHLLNFPAPEFLQELYYLTDLPNILMQQPFGEQKYANMQKFLQNSWELWSSGLISIGEQLQYIDEIVAQDKIESEAKLDAEHADVVTLMTIHAAKGLEFPVVILPDLNRRLLHPESSFVLFHPDLSLAVKGTSLYEQIKERIKLEEIQEAKRLLYVAITRAEEKLILSGVTEEDAKAGQATWWDWLVAYTGELAMRNLIKEEQLVFPEEKEGEEEKFDSDICVGNSQTDMPVRWERLTPLPPVYADTSFSVTSLMTYSQCPRRYYLRYILRAPEDLTLFQDAKSFERLDEENEQQLEISPRTITPLIRGNIIHRVCEQIQDVSQKRSLLKSASELEGVQLTPEDEESLEKIIDKYLASDYF